ncbi:hypothetical protein [Ferruginibacter profundus]
MKMLLLILLGFIAFTALASGVIIINHPDGGAMQLQLNVLDSTPFKNFLIPGIILTTVVGCTNLLAFIFCFTKYPTRYNWAIAAGIMICGWIIVQMLLINTMHWLQFVYLGAGLLVILIAYQLKGKWAV